MANEIFFVIHIQNTSTRFDKNAFQNDWALCSSKQSYRFVTESWHFNKYFTQWKESNWINFGKTGNGKKIKIELFHWQILFIYFKVYSTVEYNTNKNNNNRVAIFWGHILWAQRHTKGQTCALLCPQFVPRVPLKKNLTRKIKKNASLCALKGTIC